MTEKRHAKEYNAATVERLEAVEKAIATDGTYTDEDGNTFDAFDFFADCLEIYRDKDTNTAAVLISFGGPTTRATVSQDGEWLAVVTRWDETVTNHTHVPHLAATLTDFADALDEARTLSEY